MPVSLADQANRTNNRFFLARLKAAETDPIFAKRDLAVTRLPTVTYDSLKRYELGLNQPSCDVIAIMAEAYNDPALRMWHCAAVCPLGKGLGQIACDSTPAGAAVKLGRAAKELKGAYEILEEAIYKNSYNSEHGGDGLREAEEMLKKARACIDENLAEIEKARNARWRNRTR